MSTRVIVYTAIMTAMLLSCDKPEDTASANNQSILRHFSFIREHNGNIEVGPIGLPSLPLRVDSNRPCEGSVGSVIPPLAVFECSFALLSTPTFLLERGLGAIVGNENINIGRVILPDVDRINFVHQTKQNDCWAATLEMARAYRGLKHISQDDIISRSASYCPKLSEQQYGADAYQIMYMISILERSFDGGSRSHELCSMTECIAEAIHRRHPVIMLHAGHAVLIVGVEYMKPSSRDDPFLVRDFLVYDPSGNGEMDTISILSACRGDVFIVY